MSRDELVERARRGIEFMTAHPPGGLVRDDSSTLRELWGVLAFVMAAGSLLAGYTMVTLGRVFMTGGAVPPFAVGGKRFGEFVSGGSPNPSPQALAVALLDAQIEGGFLLTFEWVPRELNVRPSAGRLPLARVSDEEPRSTPPCGVFPRACTHGWANTPSTTLRRLTIASRCRPPTRAVSAPTTTPRRRCGRMPSRYRGRANTIGVPTPTAG